jgi:dTDP-4-amino-4,6-dideoxygalactose transaminase
MIQVTKPFLPPKEEYDALLKGIWQRNWLTNSGPLVNELELKLKEYLGLDHLLFLNNGTIALQIAIQALELKGEIITTPFSYVATTSSIVWEHCTPVFADIDPQTYNIDPLQIERAITPNTSGILATHVFGNPCDTDAIESIAKKHNLKVIYDAAHCFGTKHKGQSVFNFGDISTTSFHSTKLFHTIEGGAAITRSAELTYRMAKMRNFGHHGEGVFDGVGINGKNSEFHAAMGLCNLRYADYILARRKQQYIYYKEKLKALADQWQRLTDEQGYNYTYCPILFESEQQLLKTRKALEDEKIYPRRYFHPSLSELPYVQSQPVPVADDIASRALCLPLFHELSKEIQDMICRIILRSARY